MVFVELPVFVRCAAHLFDDDDLVNLQVTLHENPLAGDLISGGHGMRKLRVALPGRGKSGDARVIYYHWTSEQRCYLVYAYAKNVAKDLTKTQLKALADLMQEVVRDG